jgi:hypothetical protein
LGAVSSRMFVTGIARVGGVGRLEGLVRCSAGKELFVFFARGAACRSRLVGRSSFHMAGRRKERPSVGTR